TSDIYFNGSTFNGTVNTTKTGASQDNGIGGNIFTGISTFNLAAGSGNLLFGNGTADTWNAAVNFNNSSSNWVYPCYNSVGNMFNGNVTVSNTGAAGIQFCASALATATLATGNTISVGAGGFTAGALRIYGFTQLGATAQNLSLTGSATIVFSNASTFNGALTVSSPNVYTSNSTYNGVTVLTKTDGTTSNNFAGGNVFNNTLTINYTAANAVGVYWGFGSATPDIYNGDVYINNSSTDRILWGVGASTGTQFNGNVIVTQTGSAVGIATAWSAGSTCIIAAGKTISIGAAGFTTGYLGLCGITQNGSVPVNLTTTGNSSIYVGAYSGNAPSVFGGVVRLTAPDIYVRGGTFNQPAYFTKNGGGSNHNAGFQNIFNASCNINQQSSGGYFMLGYNSNDQFNDSIIVTSTSTGGINLGYSSGTGTPTLASGKSVFVGSAGFSTGNLYFGTFTQLGSAAVNLTFTGVSTALYFANSSVFGGNVTTVTPALFFNGCTFNGTVTSTKNGVTNDASSGNNTFNGAFTITNTGAGYFLMGNGNPDTWNATATFNNLSSAQHMYTAYNSSGNTFNGDVVYNNQPTATNLWIYPNNNNGGTNTQYNGNISVVNVNGGGIYFGSGAVGTSVLATGKTISVGASGFNFGLLNLKNFTQTGATAQSITTTGLSTLQFLIGTTFNGNLTTVSPTLLFNGSTFNGSVNSTKNGTSNDQSTGANTFNGTTTITVSNTGYLRLAGTTADAYNGNVTFVQSSTGAMSPSYNTNCTYAGNITVTSPVGTAITFGLGAAGISTMNGSGATAQTINITTGKTPVFTQFAMNNTGGAGVTLNTPINVSTSLALTSGLLNTTATNILTMLNTSTAPAITSASATYVNGPMVYQVQSAATNTLNLPIGTSPDCRPAVLIVKHTTAATLYNYTAQLFNANPWVAFNSGAPYIPTNMPLTVDTISGVHYWTIARTDNTGTPQPSANLSGNQQIQLFFGTNDGVYQGANLTIVKNTAATPAAWIDIGGTSALGNFSSPQAGSVTSTSAVSAFTSFSSFTLGSKNSGWDPLPIELLYFNAVPNGKDVDVTWETTTETNNNYFTIEKSADGQNFVELTNVNSKAYQGNSTSPLNYKTTDTNPLNGVSYYRLKQTDYNNNFKYFNIVSVDFNKQSFLTIFPNPTANNIYVNASDNYKNASVKVIDALGREVIIQNLSSVDNAPINLAGLMPGIYYVIIDNGTDINKTKITVQK
ncbi:MAG TPA: T9SS type A sorting domain-containing protein, partial [Bacteroidia bacterium]|nr:T9SS type A sorting domain-containing protein [Bacteroidia bacterium]